MFKGNTITELERMVNKTLGLETVKQFAMVDGFGTVIRLTNSTDSEIVRLNEILRAFGSDRRWAEVQEIDPDKCDA